MKSITAPTYAGKARIGLDTCIFRMALSRVPGDLATAPKIPGFIITDERIRNPRPDYQTKAWTLFHPALEIWINGFHLQFLNGETTGTLEVCFSFAFIEDCLQRPKAFIHVNQGIVTPQRACDIFVSLLEEITKGLGLSQVEDLEIIRLDVFADFETLNRKDVIEAFRIAKPHVLKTPGKNTREFDDFGCTHYRKATLRNQSKKGSEETKLYSRMNKIAAKLQEQVKRRRLSATARDEALQELAHLENVLRLEVVHGREKSGQCKGYEVLSDYTLEFHNAGLKLQEAFNPTLWVGLLFSRLKEQGLYGQALAIAPNPIDLLKILLKAGVSKGTASQFVLIIFEGDQACKQAGLDVQRIKKEVEKKTGKTFAAFAASTSNPFQDVISSGLAFLRIYKEPDSANPGLIRFEDEMPDYPPDVNPSSGAVMRECTFLELTLDGNDGSV